MRGAKSRLRIVDQINQDTLTISGRGADGNPQFGGFALPGMELEYLLRMPRIPRASARRIRLHWTYETAFTDSRIPSTKACAKRKCFTAAI